ncbi:hypothetical protein FJNA_24350 [Thermus sp. FJN-A]
MAATSPFYPAAIRYARLGYAILPLAEGQKRPHPRLAPRGLRDATRDPVVIAAWWRACPRCGVGLLPPEGVLVLDVDGPEVWEALRRDFPELDQASRQKTPRGGVHVFLRLPEGVRLSASTRALEGVDLRGMGRAYVVAAPTSLPHGRYEWEVPLVEPEGLPPVPTPLLARLLPPPPPPREVWTPVEGASPRRLQALLASYAERVARAPEGSRHNTLLAYAVAAFGLVGHGLSPEEAEASLMQAALASGLPEREAMEVLRWARQVGEAKPLPLEPPKTPEPRTYRGRVYARLRRWA